MSSTKWPFWRKIMLAGSLWILAVVIVFRDNPRSVLAAFAFAIGYGCLMVGFWYAMREKRGLNDPPPPVSGSESGSHRPLLRRGNSDEDNSDSEIPTGDHKSG